MVAIGTSFGQLLFFSFLGCLTAQSSILPDDLFFGPYEWLHDKCLGDFGPQNRPAATCRDCRDRDRVVLGGWPSNRFGCGLVLGHVTLGVTSQKSCISKKLKHIPATSQNTKHATVHSKNIFTPAEHFK
ncbi:hypothetical protein U1Q18_029184 [Sarracenia purpurea var. burkii]